MMQYLEENNEEIMEYDDEEVEDEKEEMENRLSNSDSEQDICDNDDEEAVPSRYLLEKDNFTKWMKYVHLHCAKMCTKNSLRWRYLFNK